ncbi:nitroreductase family deazaflavin-dependent oxidoreductase [Kribbella speibonae]|uniref:Nitroreductase family deazaflavin-dependent oxidoreductase n=1 Tax=Kribbella speibonae TaxID=1572660 RepID=A0ABY2AB12_9ACTN|nr:nitroreductase family deazaflavin-dependent oxidoreductase [Kribbella speibonae]TCC26887.1 nitroreductase family deazaflavin-dependent oxidoreductase [Kribbella speibonae]
MSGAPALPAVLADKLVAVATRALRNRRLMRTPIVLYRARLGLLFGRRMLMLEHIGRKSGTRRYVVLEVIDRPDSGSYVVVSGFGTRAQWYRNVVADPDVRIWIRSHGPARATAEMLPPDRAATSLGRYVSRHPKAWKTMKPALENTLGSPIDNRGAALPMVQFRLAGW